jgi:4-amino-4-deoxy-L-arabinose transferase-like glycosyltransferase
MTSQPSGENTAMSAQRVGWAILIIVTLYVCYFSHLGVIGFVGPDEPRYAWIARDMAETGDWVTPRLYGTPWFEKPPLLYWGGAIFFKLFGSGTPEVAARLPSAISALLATLALAWLAWRTYGEECACWLLLLLPTSVGMIGFSHAAATDMPFAGMLTIAMVCAAVVLGLTPTESTPILPRTPWLALALFGFFLGLAVLAKGPAAVILSGGAIFFWAIFTKRWREALRLLHPAAIASFCLTALPWYILCSRRNPDFFRIFIIEHNFKRYLTPEFEHVQPFWYYIPILLVAFLPWSFLVVASALAGIRQWWRTREMAPLTCLIFCWAMFCLVFFTISKSKLPGYVLPAAPAIALLSAHAISHASWFSRRMARSALLVGTICYFAIMMFFRFGVQFLVQHRNFSEGLTLTLFAIFLLYFLGTLLAGFSFSFDSNSRANSSLRAASAVVMLLLIAVIPSGLESAELDALSSKWLAQVVKNVNAETLRTVGVHRTDQYALNFYLHREIPTWAAEPVRDGFVLTDSRSCQDLKTNENCENLLAWTDVPGGWGLLKITPKDSLDRPGGGRQPR